MLDQMAVFAVMLFSLAILAMINIKRIDVLLVALLVILTPFSVATFMPRAILGVTGINVFNIVWLLNFVVVFFGILATKRRIDYFAYFSWPLILFCIAYTLCVLWAIIDIESYPHEGNQAVTTKSLLIEDLAKPAQLLLAGWMVYIFCRYGNCKQLIETSILVAAIGWGLMIVLYSSSYWGDIYEARDSVTDSTGLHSNSMAALSVYFLAFSMALRPEGKLMVCLRYLAIGFSLLGIVFTFSRIAYLTTVVIFLFLFCRLGYKEKLATMIIGAAIVITFSVQIIERLNYRMDTGNLNQVSAGRIEKLWLPLMAEVEKSPLVGSGRYTILKSDAYKYKTWGTLNIDSPHSAYIELLIDMGVIGLILLMYMLYFFYESGRRSGSGLQYLVVAMLCLGLTGHSFYPYVANYLIWIVYGISVASLNKVAETNQFAIKHRLA